MKNLIIFAISIASLIFFSCQKEISISPPGYTEKPSIQGILEPDSFPLIFLNRTTLFLSAATKSKDLIIRNAGVKITGNNSTDLLVLDSIYDYLYCQYEYFYKGKIRSSWKTTYQLDIKIDNSTYTATAITNIKKSVIDSVSYTTKFNDVYGEHEGVIVYFKDPIGPGDYYRYEQTRSIDTSMKHASIQLSLSNSCIGRDTVLVLEQGRSVYSDQNADGLQLKIVIEPAFTHREGLVSRIRIQTVDKYIFEFYDQLDKQKLAQLNPFVEPIFLTDGQFGNKAVGYFGCRTRSKEVDFVFPE